MLIKAKIREILRKTQRLETNALQGGFGLSDEMLLFKELNKVNYLLINLRDGLEDD